MPTAGAFGTGPYGAGAYGGIAATASGPLIPQYRIQIRDNTLTPIGELPDFIDGDVLLAFNDVGSFALTVRADSPMSPYFAAGNGIIISRDRGDGSGAQTLLSGPIWHLERRLQDNTYVLAGPDDLWRLKARRADPVTTYPYASTVLSDIPKRYYRLGEGSGTTATDSSTSAQNGTYSGSGVTYGVLGGIDDTDSAVTLDGSNGWVNVPGTGLPAGNTPWTLELWCKFAAYPGSTANLLTLGTAATNQEVALLLTTAGNLQCTIQGVVSAVAGMLASLNIWHHLVATWDGTTLRTYLDGVAGGTQTPAALSITLGSAAVGANIGGSGKFAGSIDEAAIYNTALSAARVLTHYQVGSARYGAAAYDTRTNTASTVIRQYVDVNAGPSALLARRVTRLALAADPTLGSIVTGNERFDNLLAAIQQLALSGGDIGFRLIQTDVGVLTFTIYQPATQSNAIFSRELGNLLDAVYTLDGPVANQYVGGGSGEGVARVFEMAQDTSSINTWGLVEGFLDARDTADSATIQERITAQLAQDAQQTNLTITPVDTPALQFGRDYNLGDIVSVQIDGATITDKIRQLHITLNDRDQELVTPGIGNAGAGQITTLFDAKQRALQAVKQRLARLQAAL